MVSIAAVSSLLLPSVPTTIYFHRYRNYRDMAYLFKDKDYILVYPNIFYYILLYPSIIVYPSFLVYPSIS